MLKTRLLHQHSYSLAVDPGCCSVRLTVLYWLNTVFSEGIAMLAAFLSILVALALGPAQNADAPKLPFTDHDVCPFGCCNNYGKWTARLTQRACKSSIKDSGLAFTIRPGETVYGLTGLIITRKAGVVIVKKQTRFYDVTVPAGAKLYVLHLGGEGVALFWYKGAAHRGELYASSVHKGNEGYPFDVQSLPQTDWWVRVRNLHGYAGWILNPREFRGVDCCGG